MPPGSPDTPELDELKGSEANMSNSNTAATASSAAAAASAAAAGGAAKGGGEGEPEARVPGKAGDAGPGRGRTTSPTHSSSSVQKKKRKKRGDAGCRSRTTSPGYEESGYENESASESSAEDQSTILWRKGVDALQFMMGVPNSPFRGERTPSQLGASGSFNWAKTGKSSRFGDTTVLSSEVPTADGGEESGDKTLSELDLKHLGWTIQVAMVKASGSIAILALLLFYAWHTFLPILDALLIAAGTSLLTHPSLHKGTFRLLRSECKKTMAVHRSRAPRGTVVHALYLMAARLQVSCIIWSFVPLFICDLLGAATIINAVGKFCGKQRNALEKLVLTVKRARRRGSSAGVFVDTPRFMSESIRGIARRGSSVIPDLIRKLKEAHADRKPGTPASAKDRPDAASPFESASKPAKRQAPANSGDRLKVPTQPSSLLAPPAKLGHPAKESSPLSAKDQSPLSGKETGASSFRFGAAGSGGVGGGGRLGRDARTPAFWAEIVFGVLFVAWLVVYFDSLLVYCVVLLVILTGTTFTLCLEPEHAVIACIFVSSITLGCVITTFVTHQLGLEVVFLVDYAKNRVEQAGDIVQGAVDHENATETALAYAYKGAQYLAESQNISLDAINDVIKVVNHNYNQTAFSSKGATDLSMWYQQYTELAAEKSWGEVGGSEDFWKNISHAFGRGSMLLSQGVFFLLQALTGMASAFMWICWTASVYIIAVMAFNRTKHTVVYSGLVMIVSEEAALTMEKQVACRLTALVKSIIHLFVFHFCLTLAALLRYGAPFPYTGAMLAGLVALFPYFPKYYFIPLPSILIHLISSDDPFNDHFLELLFVWILVPMCFGDEWIFSDSSSDVDPKIIVLSFVMGFYVWGYLGVITGPLVVVIGTI
eukprot:gene4522-7003_t